MAQFCVVFLTAIQLMQQVLHTGPIVLCTTGALAAALQAVQV